MMNLMENARQQAAAIVRAAYDKAVAAGELPQAELPNVTVETPKDASNGDWASTVAMQCAKPLRMAPARSRRLWSITWSWRAPASRRSGSQARAS